MRRIVLLPALALLLTLGAGPAWAQYDSRALYDRIDRLERDLQMMQAQAARGGAGGPTVVTSPALGGGVQQRGAYGGDSAPPLPSGMAARLDDRVDQLEEQLRQLTGKVEETHFKTAQVAKQLERLQADMDLRFKDLQEQGKGAAAAPAGQLSMPGPSTGGNTLSAKPAGSNGADNPGPAPGPQSLGSMSDKDMKKMLPSQQSAPAAPKDPQGLYDDAYAAAQRGDYSTAEREFQDFLTKNPNHQLAGNAQYWLGDIAYSKKDFGTAAATFLDGYKKFPKHTKAPDMIYKAGSAFGHLGKKKEACTAFTILFSDQPNMPDRVKRAAVAEKQKYDCR